MTFKRLSEQKHVDKKIINKNDKNNIIYPN